MSQVKSTKERLAIDLEAVNAPRAMIDRARQGYYDDYDSPIAMPCVQLVKDATDAGLTHIAQAAKEGCYDATAEESEAWARRMYATDPEMRALMDKLHLGPKPEGQ